MYYRGKHMDTGDARQPGGMKRQRLMDQGSSYYGAPAPGPSYMYSSPPPPPHGFAPPPFPVVRLRGLPFDCSEPDIIDFFHGLDVVDVLLVHKTGKFTGEAYCLLGYPVQIDFALQRNRQNIGRRYVEVFRSRKDEYYKAIANEVLDPPNVSRARSVEESRDLSEFTGILKMRGLPYSTTKEEIMDFFRDFVLSEDKIHLVINAEGRAAGEAFVEFESVEDSRTAMCKDRMTLGYRYIELFPTPREELEEAIARGRILPSVYSEFYKAIANEVVDAPVESKAKSSNEARDLEFKGVLKMKGLPYTTTRKEIMEFFKEFVLSDDKIHLLANSEGRAAGEAFVEFESVEDSRDAMSKNRMTLGHRYVELFAAANEELEEAVSRGKILPKSYEEKPAEPNPVVRMRGLPFSASKEDIIDFFKDFTVSEDSIHIISSYEGRPTGEAFVEFSSADDAKSALAKDRMTLGSRYIELFQSSPEELSEALSRGR